MYTSLKKKINEKITSLLKVCPFNIKRMSLFQPAHNMTGVDLFRFYVDQWKQFKRAAGAVNGLFYYFNCFVVRPSQRDVEMESMEHVLVVSNFLGSDRFLTC